MPNFDSNQISPSKASIIFLTIHKPTKLEFDLLLNFLKISKDKRRIFILNAIGEVKNIILIFHKKKPPNEWFFLWNK